MAKSTYCFLAHPYNSLKHQIRSQYISAKLDGMRMIWDGGISRGKPATDIPWCNSEKHARFNTPLIATGLWSRYGQPIQAPDYWLDSLPKDVMLDGEGWMGNQLFQETVSIIQTKDSSKVEGWKKIQFRIIDSPSIWAFLIPRTISETNIKLRITEDAAKWYWAQDYFKPQFPNPEPFYEVYKNLYSELPDQGEWGPILHPQYMLPDSEIEAKKYADDFAKQNVMEGGEGAVIRYKWSMWKAERNYDLLKVKPCTDMEGTVVGYTFGRETDKGSKLLGMMGSLIVQLDSGKRFGLSGFTDEERTLSGTESKEYGTAHPGEVIPDWIQAQEFPRGTRITFTYRTFSRDGIPREARFLRKRTDQG